MYSYLGRSWPKNAVAPKMKYSYLSLRVKTPMFVLPSQPVFNDFYESAFAGNLGFLKPVKRLWSSSLGRKWINIWESLLKIAKPEPHLSRYWECQPLLMHRQLLPCLWTNFWLLLTCFPSSIGFNLLGKPVIIKTLKERIFAFIESVSCLVDSRGGQPGHLPFCLLSVSVRKILMCWTPNL